MVPPASMIPVGPDAFSRRDCWMVARELANQFSSSSCHWLSGSRATCCKSKTVSVTLRAEAPRPYIV